MSSTKTYELNKKVKMYASTDVIVIGGGPAGTAAAISARRKGKSVILLEKSAQLGGMGTLGNVSIFMPIGNVTGIYRELIGEVLEQYLPDVHDQSIAPQYSPFHLRHYLNEKMKKEGVQVIYHAEFISAIQEDRQMKAVIASTREGIFAFEANQFIDCTGDARAAVEAGVPHSTGREEDGLTQPMTMMFMMQNTGKPVTQVLPEGCYHYETKEELPQGRHLFWERNDDGTLLVNMTRVKGNGAKVEDINYAETESLKQVFSVANYLQRNGFENYIVSHIPNQVGVRETNQIRGQYTLTETDILEGRRFPDVVAQTNYEIDIHSPDGKKGTDEREVSGYDIPYRCMLTDELDNFLVAGRSISATHVAMSSMRVQPTCYALGQAAGIAAAIAMDNSCTISTISIEQLHASLREQNVVFQQ